MDASNFRGTSVILFFYVILFSWWGSAETADFRASIFSGENYRRDLSILRGEDIDVLGVDYNNKVIEVFLTEKERGKLESQGMDLSVNWVRGVSAEIQIDSEYKDPFEIERFIQTAQSLFPNLARAVEIGTSVEGRKIWALKLSDNVEEREIEEPAILFNSMHHAREIMTPEVLLDLIEYVLVNSETDPKVKAWVSNNEIWVVPMLNVDGSAKVWASDPMWRKNTRDGHGVDLNRNYPFNWNQCNGSSGNKQSDTYRGASPGSEPETQALMELVSLIKPVFNISYHSFSELVLYPYGCRNQEGASNFEVIEKIGSELGTLLSYQAGTPWELLYEADGSDIDWMLGVHQVIPFVFEINSRAEGFHPDYSIRDRTVERNRAGWQHLLSRLDGPGVRGSIKDFEASGVRIKVSGSNNFVQDYEVNPDGTFHIVLEPGSYSIEVLRDQGISLSKEIRIQSSRVNLWNL